MAFIHMHGPFGEFKQFNYLYIKATAMMSYTLLL